MSQMVLAAAHLFIIIPVVRCPIYDPPVSADEMKQSATTPDEGGSKAESTTAYSVDAKPGLVPERTHCVGASVGVKVGIAVGAAVGYGVGTAVGDRVGTAVGYKVGIAVGTAVGDRVGAAVGDGHSFMYRMYPL